MGFETGLSPQGTTGMVVSEILSGVICAGRDEASLLPPGIFQEETALAKRRDAQGCCQQPELLLSASGPPPALLSSHPHGSLRKPQPIGSHQSPQSPCFLMRFPALSLF